MQVLETKLVHQVFLLLIKSHTFPAQTYVMFEQLNDLVIVRVSVLDLDNIFFSIRILGEDRGKGQIHKLSTDRSLFHKTETYPLLRGSNNVVIVSLFTMSIYVPLALRLSCGTVRLDG